MPDRVVHLRIAVVGAGRIGSTFAFRLARDHDVTVIARPGSIRLAQLRRDGAIVDVGGERAIVHVDEQLDEQVAYDLVIVTLLAHQIATVLPALQRSAAGCIQFMFNTFEPGRLQEAIGSVRCSLGMPFVQANIDGDGKLRAVIGAAGQKTLMSRQRWVDVFNAAGLPAVVERDMPLWLRCHAPLCAAFESVSVAGERRGGGASWAEALVLARGIHASFALIKELGQPIYPQTKVMIDRAPRTVVAAIFWSLSRIRSFRQLLATGDAECVALIDAMTAAARGANHAIDVAAIAAMKP